MAENVGSVRAIATARSPTPVENHPIPGGDRGLRSVRLPVRGRQVGARRRPRACPGRRARRGRHPARRTTPRARRGCRRAWSRGSRRAAPARSGLARWATHTSTSAVPRGLDRELLEPAQRPRRGPDLLERGDLAVGDLEQRLDRQRAAEQGGRGADPAAATEVLQRVDVEQRGATPRPARGRPCTASSGGAAGVEHVGSRRAPRTRWRRPPAGCRRRTPGSTRPRPRAGPTRRCRSSPPTGGSTPPPWRRPAAAVS